jgi:U6 snRNA phosphodiesterase
MTPTNSDSLGTAPSADPAAHQGRIRAHPHVEGQWATHIYLPVPLSNGRLYKFRHLLHQVIRDAREVVPELHSLIEGGDNGTDSTSNDTTPTTSVNTKLELELHISLSRPVFLRAHQREEMRRAVKRLASTTGAYVLIL